MSSGAIATIQLSSAVHHPSRRVILYGSDGTIVLGVMVGASRARIGRARGDPSGERDRRRVPGPRAARARAHRGRATGNSEAPHPTFADGLRVQEVMDAAYRSAEIGGSVAVAS